MQGHLYKSSTKYYTGSFIQKQHKTLYRVIFAEAAPNIQPFACHLNLPFDFFSLKPYI